MKYVVPLALVLLATACSRPEQDAAKQQAAAADTAQAASQKSALVEEPASEVAPVLSGTCNIETVDGVLVQNADPIEVKARVFSVAGWVIDDAAGAAPAEVKVRIASQSGDGRVWQQSVAPSLERQDVQQLHGGAAGALKSGFSTEIDSSALAAGAYRLTLSYVRGTDNVVCDNGRPVVLK